MKECPKCNFRNSDNSEECQKCGIIFKKYNKRPKEIKGDSKISTKPNPLMTELRWYTTRLTLLCLLGFILLVPVLAHKFNTFVIGHYNISLDSIFGLRLLADLLVSMVIYGFCLLITFFLTPKDKRAKNAEMAALMKADRDFIKENPDFNRVPTKGGRRNISVNSPGHTVKCAKCGSISITTIKEGYDASKGVLGLVFMGPLGLIFGASTKDNAINICQSCGNQWKLPKK
ncbi:MAG: hypothetical protein PF482_19580 [Desulfobacteraceae bacterium]|jgi:ribosomal protein L40E|nr:hypothetical protein [Desulfobacteraceae bacterium]